jgi:hypothetical protein
VNALFPTVRWRLFRTQINGGIEDCCDCLVTTADGRISDNPSDGEWIKAGIEIASVLSAHYGVIAPLFVNNAESVDALPRTSAQTIALVVDRDCPELVIEVEGQKNEEVA